MKFLIFVFIVRSFSFAQETAEDYRPPDQECKYGRVLGMRVRSIPDSAIWATTARYQRKPSYARLMHDRAWSATVNDFHQELGIDLGEMKLVTHVQTQGLRGSNEYVVHYFLKYSSDKITWLTVNDENGEPRLFNGNEDDSSITTISFEHPVVARYIIFNPQRWNKHISMRVEFWGCKFISDLAAFDGNSYYLYNVSGPLNYMQTQHDRIALRFTSDWPRGLLLYGRSVQGDYLSLELFKGQLHLFIALGGKYVSGVEGASVNTHLSAGTLLDDNQWHDVEIKRRGKEVNLTVDRLTVNKTILSDYFNLDLDQYIFIGGVDTFQYPGIVVRDNFHGCIENVFFRGMNLIYSARRDLRNTQPDKATGMRRESQSRRFASYGLVSNKCRVTKRVPVTFSTSSAYLQFPVRNRATQAIKVTFEFRSFTKHGTIFYHQFAKPEASFQLQFARNGYLEYVINEPIFKQQQARRIFHEVANPRDADTNFGNYANGLWHYVYIEMSKDIVNVTIDDLPIVSMGLQWLSASGDYGVGDTYYFGGAPYEMINAVGFQGCMRQLSLDGRQVDMTNLPAESKVNGPFNGTCQMRDRCNPNPCEHGGLCTQTWNDITCNCTNTGYFGGVCHISGNPLSCEDWRSKNREEAEAQIITIDLDGSGPLPPFKTTCEPQGATVGTIISNDVVLQVERLKKLKGGSGGTGGGGTGGKSDPDGIKVEYHSGAGSYSHQVVYDAETANIRNLVARATECKQKITYDCYNSRLLSTPPSGTTATGTAKTWGWWVGLDDQPHHYWGGSAPDSNKCGCGLKQDCSGTDVDSGIFTPCNCDAYRGDSIDVNWQSDSGDLDYKAHLPVMKIFLGDTGVTDTGLEQVGFYSLGPLQCYGDSLMTNAVTFRKPDANIEFDPLPAFSTWDIYFQFRTGLTTKSGIILQNKGQRDFVEIRLSNERTVNFRFNVGYGVQMLEAVSSNILSDDNWHTVHVERNRKESYIRVDNLSPKIIKEPLDRGFRRLVLSSKLSIGSAIDYENGFVGCIRALIINGRLYDLRGKVESKEFTYGLTPGCVGQCTSSPCLHGGICLEKYSDYECDCTYTPFRGRICGREVGVQLQQNQRIRYDIPGQDNTTFSSSEEDIHIGFTTQDHQGILMQIIGETEGKSGKQNDTLTVSINNNGGIRVSINPGPYRDEVNAFGTGSGSDTSDQLDLANSQQHSVRVRRLNKGRNISIQVDDYPLFNQKLKQFNEESTDLAINNVKWIFLGNNGSEDKIGKGFKGCLFRAEFEQQYPLKRAFQDPRPNYVYMEPKNDMQWHAESECGFEEFIWPDPPPEYRLDRFSKLVPIETGFGSQSWPESSKWLMAGVIAAVFIIVVIIIVFICKFSNRQTGAYVTKEDEGSSDYGTADLAIMQGATGQPEVQRQREFFL